MNNYNMPIWSRAYTKNVYNISDSALIQIIPSSLGANLLVFDEAGWVYHIDGYSYEIQYKIRVTTNKVICVEEVKCGEKRYCIISDDKRFLYKFDLSLKEDIVYFPRRSSVVTSIQDIGNSRSLISYSKRRSITRVELINSETGVPLRYLDLDNISRIRDFHCPSILIGKKDGWLLAASDRFIIQINFEKYELNEGKRIEVSGGIYVDEIWCDTLVRHVAGKNLVHDVGKKMIVDPRFRVSNKNRKVGSISFDYGTRIQVEGTSIYINEERARCAEYIELKHNTLYCKHLHWPYGRICLASYTGNFVVLDFRGNSLRFISDS